MLSRMLLIAGVAAMTFVAGRQLVTSLAPVNAKVQNALTASAQVGDTIKSHKWIKETK